ncbi:MalY/PatB family protein [Bacillus sp. B15-48]|uniref:MalY/PatB family protein n=1 Tax=Bacillus sp. B15-48 TaxID=1548601 RepID=UPI00193EFD53|nr:MalY/PatB family protein [Bacillus sp. B15-48]MBM4760705.1 putative C-S lyase [Bacillus sp. B15-48]
MDTFNFDQLINRKDTASVKWEMTKDIFGTEDVLPMWVADMDFPPPPKVIEAMTNRVSHGIFGYTFANQTVTEAIQHWLSTRHQWDIDKPSILFSPGVVPSISLAIQSLTNEGDKILLQSPVYSPFFSMIELNKRVVVNSQLVLKDNHYEIDFEDFESKLKDGVKLFLLCNPHNPGGRVWTKEELTKIGELCLKYNCYILADEIHSDLVFTPHRHIPIASIKDEFAEITLTCIAPTKTFNLAGIQASAVIISNSSLRKKFRAEQQKQAMTSLNLFGIYGMEAAYRFGEDWLNQLLHYLKGNIDEAIAFIQTHIPKMRVIVPDGTYLLWIDCREFKLSDKEIRERLLQKGKLGLEPGPKYGPGGEGFVRMNLACPRETLADGLNRLKKAFT